MKIIEKKRYMKHQIFMKKYAPYSFAQSLRPYLKGVRFDDPPKHDPYDVIHRDMKTAMNRMKVCCNDKYHVIYLRTVIDEINKMLDPKTKGYSSTLKFDYDVHHLHDRLLTDVDDYNFMVNLCLRNL